MVFLWNSSGHNIKCAFGQRNPNPIVQDREALADPCLKAIGDSEAKISLHNNFIALLVFFLTTLHCTRWLCCGWPLCDFPVESKLSIWCYVKIYDSLNDNNWNFHLYEDENLTFNALLKLGHNKPPLRKKRSADFVRSSSVKFHND